MTAKAAWTFMVYMAGDNDLSQAADHDLDELRQVGSSPALNLLVEVDSAGDAPSRRMRVEKNGEGEQVEALGETDSGSPETLAAFIDWAVANHPAERYALVLWNHGGGWEPDEVQEIAAEAGQPDLGAESERAARDFGSVFFRSSLAEILGRPSPAERAICSDDGSGHSLDMVELGRVLEGAVEKLGQPIDLLGMDACLMANLEVAVQVAPFARYLVASEEIEPNQGWPYREILSALAEDPAKDTARVAGDIVAAFEASYADDRHATAVSQAAFDLARLSTLTQPLDALAEALIAQLPAAATTIWAAQRKSTPFHNNTLWDIADFCQALGAATDAELAEHCQAVGRALEQGEDRFIRSYRARGGKLARCRGLSIYLLPSMLPLSPYYKDTRFAREHRWLKMLEAYHGA